MAYGGQTVPLFMSWWVLWRCCCCCCSRLMDHCLYMYVNNSSVVWMVVIMVNAGDRWSTPWTNTYHCVCNMIHVPGPPCAPCIRLYFTVTLVLSRKCRLTEFVRKLPSDLNYNMINVSLLQGLKKWLFFPVDKHVSGALENVLDIWMMSLVLMAWTYNCLQLYTTWLSDF